MSWARLLSFGFSIQIMSIFAYHISKLSRQMTFIYINTARSKCVIYSLHIITKQIPYVPYIFVIYIYKLLALQGHLFPGRDVWLTKKLRKPSEICRIKKWWYRF